MDLLPSKRRFGDLSALGKRDISVTLADDILTIKG